MDSDKFTKIFVPVSSLTVSTLAIIMSTSIALVQMNTHSREESASEINRLSERYQGALLQKLLTEWRQFSQPRHCQRDDITYERCIRYFLRYPESRQDFYVLVQFFNTVGVCTKLKLCDFDTARELVGSDVVTFYDDMYPMLNEDQPTI